MFHVEHCLVGPPEFHVKHSLADAKARKHLVQNSLGIDPARHTLERTSRQTKILSE